MAKSESGYKREGDDPSERLFSLTLALTNTEVGLTKEEIFSAIRGYRMALDRAGGLHGDLTALNKLFDRDKNDLREMGVQIDPAGNSSDGDSDYRYRISRDIYVWPEGAKLSAKQLQLLELAASIWDSAALSPEAKSAITRLRAIAEFGDASIASGVTPRIRTVEPSFMPLKSALESNAQVTFAYRKADGEEGVRTVNPWQIFHTNGLWMLLGFDLDRQAPRNFLLRRIQSKVKPTKVWFEPPAAQELEAAKKDLAEVFERNVAVIKVRPGTTAAMHFETHNDPSGIARLNYYDLGLLVEELLEFGGSVKVVSPPELSALLRTTLEQVVRNHA